MNSSSFRFPNFSATVETIEEEIVGLLKKKKRGKKLIKKFLLIFWRIFLHEKIECLSLNQKRIKD